MPGGYCGRFLEQTFPTADITHSFEYGSSASSRARGLGQLQEAVSSLFEE